jgi:hypothetical protein
MRQLLAGVPGGLPASMNELLNQNAAANPNQQQPQPQPQRFQAPPPTQQAFRQWQQAAPHVDQFPDMDTADGIPRTLLGQPPPQRARTSSEPLFPSAAPVPNPLPPSPSIGVAFIPVSALPTQQGPHHHHHHHHHHPVFWNPNVMPTAVPTAANDAPPAVPVNQARNQQNQNADGQPPGDEPGRGAFVTLWDPIRGRMFTTTTPLPEMGTQPPITGHGVGWTVPVAGPDGNMTTRFVGFGAGTVHGLGIPGLDPERPPDTRRAKELLRGLNLVPRGLVRRMERVEKMLGEEGAEGGRLVCAVCYDPLLGPVSEQPAVPLHTEDETDVAMDGHAPSGSRIDANSDSKPKLSQEISEDSTAKTKQKMKPKHPSLGPDALIALPCTHVFHAVDCLLPWFEQGKTTCPTCRFDVDPHSETLNIGRWLGGAARRRRAAAANAASGSATGTPNSSTEPAASAAGAAVPMDAEEEDDETDAFAVEDEEVPGDLDPNLLFREAIGRAVATALTQALMNQTPPQHQMTLPPSANPTTGDAVMADGAIGTIGSGPPTPQAEWTRRFDSTVMDHLGMMGRMRSLNPGIELPGANRDQDGRMFRDDGESSVAATADSSSESDNSDDPLAREQVEFGLPRRARAQAPSPSPPLAVNPEASGGRTLRSSSRLNGTSSTTTSDRSTALDRFRDDLMLFDTPNAGPSNSGQAASSTSRPPTPFRHHPYANARPAPNFNPRPTPTAGTQVPVQNPPGPNGTTAEHTAAGVRTGPPVLIGPHGEMIYQRGDGSGHVSITRHSITFNLALPPAEQLTQPTTVNPADLTGNNHPQQQQQQQRQQRQQQQRADATARIPEFLSNVFTRTGIFGPPPTTATGTANGNRTERPPPRPRRKWVAPEGTSLRSVIESKERQVGLRCDDVSCLWAPEDGDDVTMEVTIHPDRTYLRKTASDGVASCTHRYHPECLLVASRVAEAGLDREIDAVGGEEWLEVACPFCRVHGGQEKSEWKMYRDLADSAQ